MAHFAQIENGLVVNVIKVANEDILDGDGNESEAIGIQFCKDLLGDQDSTWVQTSYTTASGKRVDVDTGLPIDGDSGLRKNFAGIGMTYDADRDAFYDPQPYPSWTLDEDTCTWVPPVPQPAQDTEGYEWDETAQNWVQVSTPSE